MDQYVQKLKSLTNLLNNIPVKQKTIYEQLKEIKSSDQLLTQFAIELTKRKIEEAEKQEMQILTQITPKRGIHTTRVKYQGVEYLIKTFPHELVKNNMANQLIKLGEILENRVFQLNTQEGPKIHGIIIMCPFLANSETNRKKITRIYAPTNFVNLGYNSQQILNLNLTKYPSF